MLIEKRDGRVEDFNSKKLERVILWATDGNETFAKVLHEDALDAFWKDKKILKTSELISDLEIISLRKFTAITPAWGDVAKKLSYINIKKNNFNIKSNEYPICIYPDNTLFTDAEIKQLNEYIKPDRDFTFTYKGLSLFIDKYCLKNENGKLLELPQNTYMRVAAFLASNEHKDIRIDLAKRFYDHLSQHKLTLATPIMINAGTKSAQMSSCVLLGMKDDTDGILNTLKRVAKYSKYTAGLSVDVSDIRSAGSLVRGNNGLSSGKIPYIQLIEKTVTAWKQGNTRRGSACVYSNWWDDDILNFIQLKSNTGTEENRARHIQLCVKINNCLFDYCDNDDEVVLFNPVDVPGLHKKYGYHFEKEYKKYVEKYKKGKIKGKSIKARDLMFKILKERVETGNLYIFFTDNVNTNTPLTRFIHSSNLCTEITEPIDYDGEDYGVSLCNLTSINLVKWYLMDEKQQNMFVWDVVRMLDNTIDLSFYPDKEAERINKKYRYLGIGVTNFAYLLARKGLSWSNADKFTGEIFYKLSYQILSASSGLASLKGKCEGFNETRYSKNFEDNDFYLPWYPYGADDFYSYDTAKDNELVQKIRMYGIRNCLTMSIAPTATSGKVINATESCEPVIDIFYREEGSESLLTLVPGYNKYKYELAFDINPYSLIRVAAIRQIYIDQAMSTNMYLTSDFVSSFKRVYDLHKYACNAGLKTLYYLRTNKDKVETCEWCEA